MSQMFLDAMAGFNAGAQQAGATIQQGQMAQVDAAWKNRKLAMEDEKLAEDLASSRESRRRADEMLMLSKAEGARSEKRLSSELLSAEENIKASETQRRLSEERFKREGKSSAEQQIEAIEKLYPNLSEDEKSFLLDTIVTKGVGLNDSTSSVRDLSSGGSKKIGLGDKEINTMAKDIESTSVKIAELYRQKAEVTDLIAQGGADTGQVKALDKSISMLETLQKEKMTRYKNAELGFDPDNDEELINIRGKARVVEAEHMTWREQLEAKKNRKALKNSEFDSLLGLGGEGVTRNNLESPALKDQQDAVVKGVMSKALADDRSPIIPPPTQAEMNATPMLEDRGSEPLAPALKPIGGGGQKATRSDVERKTIIKDFVSDIIIQQAPEFKFKPGSGGESMNAGRKYVDANLDKIIEKAGGLNASKDDIIRAIREVYRGKRDLTK